MLKTVKDIPGLREVLDECANKVQDILGKPVTILYKLKVHHISTEELCRIVCEVCEVSWMQITSERRDRHIVVARHLYCYIACTYQNKTLTRIAEIIKQKSHTSVFHAVNKVKAMIINNDELYTKPLEIIEQKIEEQIRKFPV